MNTIRAFFAINVSLDVIRRLAEALRGARDRCAEAGWSVKWIGPPNVHLVLRDLGELCTVLPEPLREGLRKSIEPLPALELRTRGIRVVAPPEAEPERPHLIVSDVEFERGRLEALWAALSESLEELGFGPQPELPPPRLILGRATSGEEPRPALDELLADLRERDFGLSIARDLLLFRSDSHAPRGEFLRLWRLPFAGPRGAEAPPVMPPQPPKQSEQARSLDEQPFDEQPFEDQPFEDQPFDEQPFDEQLEDQPFEDQPFEDQSASDDQDNQEGEIDDA